MLIITTDQRDAVADAVVDARDECAAALVVLDRVESATAGARVERRGGQLAAGACSALALACPRGPGSASAQHVLLMSNWRIIHPGGAHGVGHGLLAEAVVLQQLVARCARAGSPA
jgi:hypothetical protein